MHFPKYWIKATWRGTDTDGRAIDREAWGWSDTSDDEARRQAEQRAQRIGESQRDGPPTQHYGYPNRPLREPVLRTLADGATGVHAVITRNSYGCDVLNADRVVFIDVDLPSLPRASSGLFASLFGRKKPQDDPRIAVEAEKIARLEVWQRAHPTWAFRVYRTAAGLRYLLTSALGSPDDALVNELMEATSADPEYHRLCRQQKSFRARLSPKPWRCDAHKPPHRFPFADERQLAAMTKWLASYASAAANFAVCTHLVDVGAAPIATAIAPLLSEHDRLTRAGSALPLA